MADIKRGEESTAPTTTTANMSSKKKELLSSALKRTSEWIFSQEIPSDICINVGGVSFSLHKFPLISKSGRIRKLISESSDAADLSVIELSDVPGGSEAFELAAKFCYGINFEISTENIAMLLCVAEYLLMTEDYAVGNLVGRADAYLNEVALKSLAGAVTVLHTSESFLPMAEKVKLVNRCIDAIAFIACKESQFSVSSRADGGNEGAVSSAVYHSKPVVDWWAEDLIVLRIDMFQRVMIAMMARGFKQYALGPVLILYAQKSLRGLEIFGKGRKKIEPRQEHEKRVVLETIVSLLPREKNAMSVSFLSMLLRAAKTLETTVACQLDLEKRMGLQLAQAVLDDLLIPSYSYTGDTLLDVDTVQRIVTNYLEYEMQGSRLGYNAEDDFGSPPPTDMERVGKLMENYLAELATDRNVSVSKFIGIAELIPEQSRETEDGMYRAIDIYLKGSEFRTPLCSFLFSSLGLYKSKENRGAETRGGVQNENTAHPALSDMERKKVCSMMDCQKLSREACAHAAQNDRLPVQTVVQVLYYEQQRLRDVMNGNPMGAESSVLPSKGSLYSTDIHHPVPDELTILRRQNEELKIELVKMKMKLKELETSTTRTAVISPMGNTPASADKPPLPRKSFINSVSKKLGKLSPFVRADGVTPTGAKGRTKPAKDRRHSIS